MTIKVKYENGVLTPLKKIRLRARAFTKLSSNAPETERKQNAKKKPLS